MDRVNFNASVHEAGATTGRTMGLIFGLARGFVFVAIAYLFYGWLLPFDKQEVWVREAMSLPYVQSTGEALLTFMPPDIADTLTNTALQRNPEAGTGAPQPGQSECVFVPRSGERVKTFSIPDLTSGPDAVVLSISLY